MRRVMTAVVLAVLAVTTWLLPSFAKDDCIPVCSDNGTSKKQTCVCVDLTQNTEPDSTEALLAISPDVIYGLAARFRTPALTLGIHASGNHTDSWMENSLEKPHTAPPPKAGGATILSTRVTQAKADVFESGYVMSVKSPSEHPKFSVSVLHKGKVIWSGSNKPAGDLVIVNAWPRFASAGMRKGVPTVGWAYAEAQAIHIPGTLAKMDTTVMGDQVRVALEKSKGPSSGILRLHCSPGIESIKVESVRDGLFNLAIKK